MTSYSNKFGENLRNIRKAFGETQAQLAESIHVSNKTISAYEKGSRYPEPEIIQSIANHYLISVGELTTMNSRPIGNFTFDPFIIIRNVDIIFPIITSENAMKNSHFYRANEIHTSLFREIKNYRFDFWDRFIIALDDYNNAYTNADIQEECAANLIGIWFLLRVFFVYSSSLLELNPGIMNLPLIKQSIKQSKINITIPEEQIVTFLDSIKEITKIFKSKEFKKSYIEWKRKLKQSKTWDSLADYYIALECFHGFIGNSIDVTASSGIYSKVMKEYASLGNQYCKHFLFISKQMLIKK